MKKTIVLIMTFIVAVTTMSGQSWTADNGNGTYTNPLFYDEFSDPDIIRVGSDFYLVGTSMFERFAKSSRERYMLSVAPSSSSP